MKNIVRFIFIGLGFTSLGLGIIGIVLPILPTTPFLLLAAACFARGSDRFHIWFISTGLYKKYIENAIHKKEMTRKAKRKLLLTVSCMLCWGIVMSPVWYAKLLIGTILAFHYYYFLFRIKTVKENAEQTQILEQQEGMQRSIDTGEIADGCE